MRSLKLASFLSCILVTGCIENPHHEVPINIASLEDQYEIDTVIHEIETILKSIGHPHDLKKIPVIVTDTLNGDGKCILSSENSAILINKDLFFNEDLDPKLNQISRLWSVILHEIGHCVFHRVHEEKNIAPRTGFVFQFKLKIRSHNNYHCFYNNKTLWPGTVMRKNGISVTPDSLKEFYVKELVGAVARPTPEDVLQYNEIQLASTVDISDFSEPTNCP